MCRLGERMEDGWYWAGFRIGMGYWYDTGIGMVYDLDWYRTRTID